MAKQGEIDYLKIIGEEATERTFEKPFADDACSRYLTDVAAILSLLPPPRKIT